MAVQVTPRWYSFSSWRLVATAFPVSGGGYGFSSWRLDGTACTRGSVLAQAILVIVGSPGFAVKPTKSTASIAF